MLQGVPKKSWHSWETKTLGTSYSETTYLLDLKLWQQGVLMSTPCCQISTAYRLVVSGYEVPKVSVSQECRLFFGTPCTTTMYYVVIQLSHCIHCYFISFLTGLFGATVITISYPVPGWGALSTGTTNIFPDRGRGAASTGTLASLLTRNALALVHLISSTPF